MNENNKVEGVSAGVDDLKGIKLTEAEKDRVLGRIFESQPEKIQPTGSFAQLLLIALSGYRSLLARILHKL